ncbi:MAG: hypothetical protein WD009_09220 [Phycisphaeraceae bacterium]
MGETQLAFTWEVFRELALRVDLTSQSNTEGWAKLCYLPLS